MQMHCRHCGEGWDNDDFHEGEEGTYHEWVGLFKQYGCPAADLVLRGGSLLSSGSLSECDAEPVCDERALDGIEAIQDLLGEDTDGIMSMEEDLLGGYW